MGLGHCHLDGLSLRSHYNHEALTDNTDIDIGSLELLAEYPWSDDGTSFELLTFDGGTITGRSTFAREYDVSPLADILRYVAEAVRGLDAEVLVDPSSALINLSFGEPSWQPDSGRTAQTFADAVRKWGMCVFTSAGNDGPALSTLGSPGDLTAPIVVGAFISPAMMSDQYSMLEPAPPTGDG